MAIKLIERNAHVCFKIITRTTMTWQASGSESKKQYGNQLFHFLPLTQQMDAIHFSGLDEAKFGVSFVHTSSLPTLQPFTIDYPQGDRGGNEICVGVTEAGQPMDLHRFWDGVITSSSNLTRLRNEATALRNRQEFQRGQLTELANTDFESWARRASRLRRRSLTATVGGLGFRGVGIWIARWSQRLPCFLWATLLARAGLLTEG